MQHIFKIGYYDGQSAKRHDGRLILRPTCWEIELLDDASKTIYWTLKHIQKNDTSSQINTYRYGEFPHQTIECDDPALSTSLLDTYPDYSFVNRSWSILQSLRWKGIALLSILLIGFSALFFFVIMPAGASFLAGKLPMNVEIQLGDYIAQEIMTELEVDAVKTEALQKFAQELDFQTVYPLNFTVVQSDELNAFALPGGKIVVFSKLIEALETPESLAALLGHEAAHVEKRHALKGIARNLSNYLFFSLLFGDVSGAMSIIVENAQQVYQLSYSRALEHEADTYGLVVLANNNLDQHGMVELFAVLKAAIGDQSSLLPILSSHPLTEDRQSFAQSVANEQASFTANDALNRAFYRLKE